VTYNIRVHIYVYLIEHGDLMNDADLVKEFRRGNRDAFSELVRKYSRPLTMMILKMVRDQEAAKDISQTVFLKAFEGLSRFMMVSSFKTWLYRIAMNAITDHLRKPTFASETEEIEQLPDTAQSPWEQLEKGLYVKHMREAIARLPEKQRLTIQLRIYEEMDYKEIARILGGTAAAARGNFFQATRTLRRTLEKYHENN